MTSSGGPPDPPALRHTTSPAVNDYRRSQATSASLASDREAIRARVRATLQAKQLPLFAQMGQLCYVITGVTNVTCEDGPGIGAALRKALLHNHPDRQGLTLN